MLDLSGAKDRRDHAAGLLQTHAEADQQAGAGEGVQIGGQEGRRVEQAKARHPQHAVQIVAGIVAAQVVPDELLVLGLCRVEVEDLVDLRDVERRVVNGLKRLRGCDRRGFF